MTGYALRGEVDHAARSSDDTQRRIENELDKPKMLISIQAGADRSALG